MLTLRRKTTQLIHLVTLLALLVTSMMPTYVAHAQTGEPLDPLPTSDCIKPPADMVAWYSFDDPSHLAAYDLIGSNDGAYYGTTSIGEWVDNGRAFDGVDDYVRVKDDSALNFGKGDFSIDVWIRTDNSGTYNVFIDKRDDAPIGYELLLYNGRLLFQMADNVNGWLNHYNPASVQINDGKWHLVAVTVDRDQADGGKLYVDGQQIHEFNPTSRAGSLDNKADLFIGRHHSNNAMDRDMYYQGDLDEVELFKRALKAEEIKKLYEAGRAGKCKKDIQGCVKPPANMPAWYPFDEPNGAIANDLMNGNHGSHVNGPTHIAGKVAGALGFDGADDFVEVASTMENNFGTGDWSFDAWIRTRYDGSYNVIIDKRDERPVGYEVLLYNGQLMAQMADEGNGALNYHNPDSPKLNDGKWHFVAVTVDRDDENGGKLYADGVLIHTFNPTSRAGSLDNDAVLFIGAHHSNNAMGRDMYYQGDIDEVELFNRALTADEVMMLFNADGFGKCKKLLPIPSDKEPRELIVNAQSEGELSVSYGKVYFPIRATGQDVIVEANETTWTVDDRTQLKAGWNVTMIALDHLRGESKPEENVLRIGESEELKVRGCLNAELVGDTVGVKPPICQENLRAVPIVGESPLLLISAEPNTGMNTWQFSPQFQLFFSSLDAVDNYTAAFNLTISSGP